MHCIVFISVISKECILSYQYKFQYEEQLNICIPVVYVTRLSINNTYKWTCHILIKVLKRRILHKVNIDTNNNAHK